MKMIDPNVRSSTNGDKQEASFFMAHGRKNRAKCANMGDNQKMSLTQELRISKWFIGRSYRNNNQDYITNRDKSITNGDKQKTVFLTYGLHN